MWFAHAVGMGNVAGQVEDDLLAFNGGVHRLGIAHVARFDRYIVAHFDDVVRIAPALGNQGVQQRYAGAKAHEPDGQVAAEETETACDQHAPAAVATVERGVWLGHGASRRVTAFSRLHIQNSPTEISYRAR